MPPSRSSRTGSARPSAGPSSSRGTPGRKGGPRPSTSTSTSTTTTTTTAPTALPAYEAPVAPLTRSAQHSLSTLPIKHDLSSLQGRLADAHERLAGAAADMHEMKTMRVEMAGVRATKRRERGEKVDTADDERLEDLVRRVDAMTERIEREVRRTVDREARMADSEEALRELSANQTHNPRQQQHRAAATQASSANGATQSSFAASQGPIAQTQMTDATDATENEGPTAVSVVQALQTKLKTAEAKYEALTMRERYSAHNSYIAFRKMLHSAQYPDDAAAPPVPHASSWFDESTGSVRALKPAEPGAVEAPAASQSMLPPPLPNWGSNGNSNSNGNGHGNWGGTQPNGAEDSDGESDIEAIAERTSIKCPLTLQPMHEPMSSRKCPHSFERAAILEYLSSGSTATGRRGRPRAAKCPVCEVLLTPDDLHIDRVLQRKIRRIQEAEARRGEEAEDEDDNDEAEDNKGTKAHLIGSSSPLRSTAPPGSASASGKVAARIKAERLSAFRRTAEDMDVDDDEDEAQ